MLHTFSLKNRLSSFISRSAVASVATICLATSAHADDKVTFLTSWFAQAEHGGFYQAVAKGIYKKYGLDVTVKMGGPQVNGMQLLAAGQADFIMGYDFQVLNSIEKGLPVVTVGTSFQKDLQGIMTHDDVKSLADLKGKTILAATTAHTTWVPWVKAKYGFADSQFRAYTFNLQPFFTDATLSQQAYPSSEPFQAMKNNVKVNFFLFADEGYPPYGTTIVSTQKLVAEKPDLVARFVKASIEGWKSYLADPAAANEMIKKDNPKMDDEQIAYGVKRMKELHVFDGGDAAKLGAGIMTDARWEQTYKFMVGAGLLKADTDWKKAYTTQFVKDLKIMPGAFLCTAQQSRGSAALSEGDRVGTPAEGDDSLVMRHHQQGMEDFHHARNTTESSASLLVRNHADRQTRRRPAALHAARREDRRVEESRRDTGGPARPLLSSHGKAVERLRRGRQHRLRLSRLELRLQRQLREDSASASDGDPCGCEGARLPLPGKIRLCVGRAGRSAATHHGYS
jgi:NitT/TauT family transport system substrate-binding protein